MTRREEREHIFKLLFIKDFHEKDELDEQFALYIEHFPNLSEEEISKLNLRFSDICNHLDRIDPMLADATSGWTLNRMNRTDLCLLRLATFEIKFDDDIPDKVAINEAVEISKLYGGESSSSFVNGILAKILKISI